MTTQDRMEVLRAPMEDQLSRRLNSKLAMRAIRWRITAKDPCKKIMLINHLDTRERVVASPDSNVANRAEVAQLNIKLLLKMNPRAKTSLVLLKDQAITVPRTRSIVLVAGLESAATFLEVDK